jgi:hypothetical protein
VTGSGVLLPLSAATAVPVRAGELPAVVEPTIVGVAIG